MIAAGAIGAGDTSTIMRPYMIVRRAGVLGDGLPETFFRTLLFSGGL